MQRKMQSQKGPRKETKIDESFVKNLGIELDPPNVVTLLRRRGSVHQMSPLLLKIVGQ